MLPKNIYFLDQGQNLDLNLTLHRKQILTVPSLYGGWPVRGGCVNSKQLSTELWLPPKGSCIFQVFKKIRFKYCQNVTCNLCTLVVRIQCMIQLPAHIFCYYRYFRAKCKAWHICARCLSTSNQSEYSSI